MTQELERPRWAEGAPLACCGFTTRDAPGPPAQACARQLHGRDVHHADPRVAPPDGDGLWSTTPGLHVAVRVADCVPVLLWDPAVPAVAAVHAGWRGTAADILGAALDVGAPLGVRPERVRAAIGPSIGVCHFEVGDEVVAGLRGLGLGDAAPGLRDGPRGRPHVNLRAVNRALLVRRGVPDGQIEDVGGCTVCEARYESHRRDGAASGRLRGVIALLGALLAMLLAGCSEPPPPTDAEVSAGSDEAREALAEGRAAVAEEQLRGLLRSRPDDAHLRASLAMALHRQGRYAEASVQSRLALGADPTLWQAAYNLACHHAAAGERDRAIAWLQTAIAAGYVSVEDVLADPDLAPLAEDHRFAFYVGTGVLSRAEEDAVVLLHTPVVQVGERATVSVVSIALNRPLMGEREPADLRLASSPAAGVLRPVSRRETFSVGVEGGLEYHQRTFHFTFEPLQAGVVQLGPFEVFRGGRSRWTEPVLLQVRDATETPRSHAVAVPPAVATPEQFFRAPSTGDPPLVAAHRARAGEVIEIDALATEPVQEAPWTQTDEGESRYFRFKAASIESLPATLPEREPGIFRSILVQRATEGWSHMLELRAADDR